jgi:hypothetical protein
MNEKNKTSDGRARWGRYALVLVIVPVTIPMVCLYLRGQGWSGLNLSVIGLLFAWYWFSVIAIAARLIPRGAPAGTARLASPLIELRLSSDLQDRLAEFAAARQQKMAVAAFELLDHEIPRFDQDEDRTRARSDNEHLRQQAGQGTFVVAVTAEILRRLLLLSGAGEDNRRLWRSYVSETAARIVRDALDHREPLLQ